MASSGCGPAAWIVAPEEGGRSTKLADVSHNWAWNGVRRTGFGVFAVVGLVAVVGALARLQGASGMHLALAAVALGSVLAIESNRFAVGWAPYRTMSFTLSIMTLPVLSPVLGPQIAVGILALGTLLRSLTITKRLPVALYAAGLAGSGGTVFLLIFSQLGAAGWPILPSVLLSALCCLVALLAVEWLRRTSIGTPWKLGHFAGVSSVRAVVVLSGAVVVTVLTAFWNHPDLPFFQEAELERNAAAVLLMITVIGVATRLSTRVEHMQRRFNGLIEGTAALNAQSFGHATNSESFAELVCAAVTATIGAQAVAIRESPGSSREISAEVTLVQGQLLFIVAQRDPMDHAFTCDDQTALTALARATDVVVRARHDIGGLTVRANTDPLTGLPNYGAFQAALSNINDHRNYSEALAVLFLDLDDFKRLNDRLGHEAGDDVLRSLGSRLRRNVRPFDVVARVGGDEFVIILTRLSSLAEAKLIADGILAATSAPLILGQNTVRPLLSIGLAFSAHRETDVAQLVRDADESMLAIKESRRRGGPAHESSINISSHNSPQVNDRIAEAITEGLLELAYQPIVSLVTNQIWAFEALVRFTDEELGAMSPPSLVEKAKSLGMLDDLTRQVAEKAMAAAERLRLVEPGIVCMTVNVEAVQVLPERLGLFVEDLASRYPGVSLCLELNERSVARVSPALRLQVEHLRDIGVLIALDDYGSEDSSVDSLVRVPMDILKIDKSLIDDLDDIRQREVLTALQGFGDNLEYSMVVEGVENEIMARHLSSLGIRSAQGFHYGMPAGLTQTLARLTQFGIAAIVPELLSTADTVHAGPARP